MKILPLDPVSLEFLFLNDHYYSKYPQSGETTCIHSLNASIGHFPTAVVSLSEETQRSSYELEPCFISQMSVHKNEKKN